MALAPDDRLGPYRIETLLGAGGMGEVYRGTDTRLGRAVALKVISAALVGDAASRRRFELEARAASALNHPSIVTIYDIGESAGVSWIAMELIEGHTLSEALAQGPMPVRSAWSIARQLADGLAVAHAKGIVHRDLKPANVMVTDEGRVKILDFGLARQTVMAMPTQSDETAAAVEHTVAGTILGTVGYMSPEQAASRPADFRADQFSYGALVYELLAGRRAFARPTVVETLSAIMRDEPPPLRLIRPDVSDAFQGVINRCLAKEPAQRFESTRDLTIALDALTPESSTLAAAGVTTITSPPPVVGARASAASTWGMAAAVVVLAAVAAVLLWSWRDRAAPPVNSVAVLPFENTAQDPDIEYIGAGVTDGLIDHLSRAESLKVMARATVMRFQGQRDPQEAARALGVRAVVTGSVSRRGTQVVISAELIDGATGERLWGQTFDRPRTDLMHVQDTIVLSIAESLRLRLSGEERERLGGFGTSSPEAYELFLKARFLMQDETEAGDLEALGLFRQATDQDPNFLDAHLGIASVYARRAGNGYDPPREANGHAAAALAKAAAIDPASVAVRVAAIHQRFVTTHDWAAAERDYRAVMFNPVVLRSSQYHPITLFLVAIGRPDDAVAVVERALAIDPGNLESRAMLGSFLLQAGRLDEALRVYDALAAEAPGDPRPLFGAADVHKRRGDYPRASETRRIAYQQLDDEAGARAFAQATTEAAYARAELAIAKAELREKQELATIRYVPPLDLARLHALVGNREQALAGLEGAVDDEYVGLMLLKADQAWDSVRDDPRFAAIVRRIGIP